MFILISAAGYAQDSAIQQNRIVRHPDGIIGRPNGQIFGSYSSVSAERASDLVDRKTLGIDIGLPASKDLYFFCGYYGEYVGAFFHNIEIGGRFYPRNPLDSLKECNPDGTLFAPVISLSFLHTLKDENNRINRQRYNLDLLLPISPLLTPGVGISLYHRKPAYDAEEFSLSLNLYTSKYETGQNYSNPDGPEGAPAFSLKAGGSGDGYFGQVGLIFPIESSLTLLINLRREKVSSPRIVSNIAAFRLKFYPGN